MFESLKAKAKLGALAVLVIIGGCSKAPPSPTPTPVASWVYQLQAVDLQEIAKREGRVVVIDPSRNGDGDSTGFWNPSDLEVIKEDGRTTLAYLAIGEAEDYRDYWQPGWKANPPEFIAKSVDDQFAGNYAVRYWKEAWQQILFERVDRIVAAGFDGVYLDKVDAFQDWETAETTVDLPREMATLVTRIAERGRKTNPNFQVFLQNGWGVWSRPELADIVNGVAIEELSLGWEGKDGAPTPVEIKNEMSAALEAARSRGWTMLVVDYPSADSKSEEKQSAMEEARRVGALPLLAPRSLDG